MILMQEQHRVISVISIIKTFILFFFLFPSFGWATDYYVKTGGNDGFAGTSGETAWATTAKVEATVSNGDTIYFDNASTWNAVSGSRVLKTTAGNVIYDGESWGDGTKAKFVAVGNHAPVAYGVVHIYKSDITFKGFDVDGGADQYWNSGIIVDTCDDLMSPNCDDVSNIHIENCDVHNTGLTDDPNTGHWGYGILISSGNTKTLSNIELINCEVSYAFHEGIAIYPAWGSYDNKVDNVLVQECYLHDNGKVSGLGIHAGSGISINNDSDNVTIENCVLSNNDADGINTRCSPESEGPGNVLSAPNNMVIRYNIISDNYWYGLKAQNYRNYVQTGDIYGNIFYNNGDSGMSALAELLITSSSFTWEGSIFNIYNNTFYSTHDPGLGYYRCSVGFGWNTGSLEGCTINFKNNIIYTSLSNIWGIYDIKGATVNHSNNEYYNAGGATAWLYVTASTHYDRNGGGNDITVWEATAQKTDPDFVDVGSNNFDINAGSAAINNGTDPFVDGDGDIYDYAGIQIWDDGTDSPVGPWADGVDIGAYGYGAFSCGDGNCDAGECITGCTDDCAVVDCCGIEGCNVAIGETVGNCPGDCSEDPPPVESGAPGLSSVGYSGVGIN